MSAAALARFVSFGAVIAGSCLLAACGGGGGDSGGSPPAATAFPLAAGYQARLAAGGTVSYTVSGSCGGTYTETASPAAVSTFEGVTGHLVTRTESLSLTGCSPASKSATGTSYYDSNYTPIGTVSNDEYETSGSSAVSPVPANVKIGDSGSVSTLAVYADSSKASALGREELSYVVEADTASTVIVNFITKSYDTSNTLLLTQQDRSRLAADGTLTEISTDLQYGAPSNLHLVLTKS